MIYPYLTYCVTAWGSCCPTNLNPLNVLQRRAVRIICNKGTRADSEALFKQLEILKVYDVFRLYCALYFYCIINEYKAPYINIKINEWQIHNEMELRNNNKLRLPKVKVLRYKQSLLYQGIVQWNILPYDIKTIQTVNSFKRLMKLFLKGKFD